MGGQACVLYGGAEFSRDTDVLVLADDAIETAAGPIEVLSLPDLVTAKKTQRDKDWPMITRLVEADYADNRRKGVVHACTADRFGPERDHGKACCRWHAHHG
jgi:hypothetical protein